MWKFLTVVILTTLTLLAGTHPAPGQALSRRLILKDGSYQAVLKYEIKGSRVRYLSAERNEWEEVPSSLVDWEATRKYEAARSRGEAPPETAATQEELRAEEAADRAAAEAAMPTVAPGLRLPDTEGVLLLDNFQNAPQLVEVEQNSGDVKRDMKGNILRSTINPLASSKQQIVLKGAHSPIQAHTVRPVIYLKLEEEDASDAKLHSGPAEPPRAAKPQGSMQKPQGPVQPEQPQRPAQPLMEAGQHYRLVRLQDKKDSRVVGAIKIAIYGKVSQQTGAVIPTTSERITGNWVKLTPMHDLAPGEYALVEMVSPKEMNLFVWDFGINPAAPANPSAWKPQPAAGTSPHSPALDQRQ